MLLVRLDGKEYIPFLQADSIKLKDARSNCICVKDGELSVKDLEAFVGKTQTWKNCSYQELRGLLEIKTEAIRDLRQQVMSGEWEELERTRREILI